jgi:4-amino-4-deoxy-L-arabinose transferase-like glycosyltransferase
MPFSVEGRPSWSAQQDRQLRHQLARIPTAARESGAGGAARYSPLYYGFEALAAKAGGGMSAIDRLYAMRVLSATLAGATVAFVFLFLRELLPGTPWAWVVGALAVAFQPVFGFIGGGVNNDNLLFTASAALLFLVARSFRQGLTVRRGVAIGAVAMAGFLAKPTMLGLLPGAALGVALIVWRTPPGRRRAAVTAALAGLAVFAGAAAAWLAIDAAVFHRPLSETTGVLATSKVNGVTSLQGQLSYLWQFFLPKLPFMHEAFPTYPHYPVWDIYIQGFIGRFGWFQYGFPMSVNRAGFAVLLLVVALAGVALVRARDRVRRRWPELACYATMLVGVVLLVGGAGYRFQASVGMGFEQPRYLFPCLALYGAVLALAARAAGRRWGPALGAFLVVVAMAHSLFAMLLTVGRYYA